MTIEGAHGNRRWRDRLLDRVVDRITDGMATPLADRVPDRVVAVVADDKSAAVAVDAGPGVLSPASSTAPSLAVTTAGRRTNGLDWVVAVALLRSFIQLSGALAAVLAGGALSAHLVARQQWDAAATATDQAAKAYLQASAETFSDVAGTLMTAGIGCFIVLVLVLALEALHDRGAARG